MGPCSIWRGNVFLLGLGAPFTARTGLLHQSRNRSKCMKPSGVIASLQGGPCKRPSETQTQKRACSVTGSVCQCLRQQGITADRIARGSSSSACSIFLRPMIPIRPGALRSELEASPQDKRGFRSFSQTEYDHGHEQFGADVLLSRRSVISKPILCKQWPGLQPTDPGATT